MRNGTRALALGFTLAAYGSCAGHIDQPSGASTTGGVNAGAGGGSSVAAGGSALSGTLNAGTSGSVSGSGSGGASSSGTGPAEAGAGGAAPLAAEASLMPLQGSGVSGSALFIEKGDQVELRITLKGCPMGAHALHLHANAACGDNGNASGGHWSPQGEGLGDIECGADGQATFSFSAPAGQWSIGAPAVSDVLAHALILHAGPNLPDPGPRIACGIPGKLP